MSERDGGQRAAVMVRRDVGGGRWRILRRDAAATWVVGMVAMVSLAHGGEPVGAHAFLERLCDDFGGRMTGTAANAGAMTRLEEALRAMGHAPEREVFSVPGWERGDDRVEMMAPVTRRLRVAALGGVQAHAPFEAEIVAIGNGRAGDYPKTDEGMREAGADGEGSNVMVRGKVGLLSAGTPLQMREIMANAQARGLRGVLFVNRESGGQLLARTGSYFGEALAVPVYSIAQEEGWWMERLLARGTAVRVRMETKSHVLEKKVDVANLRMVITGERASRIVVGAHFDSWDLGQGAMDNGLGIAQLYAVAMALRGARLHHTVELVWFNGEEQGLLGSRHAAARLGDAPIVAMINLDMVGVPIAVNALGDDSLVPALERWQAARGEKGRLAKGVENLNWVASDHTPYQLAGVRCITFNAPIPRESVRYYHDFADTIDKVSPQLANDSAAIVIDLVKVLAADASLEAWRRPPKETEALFTRFGVDRRLRAVGLWPFSP